MDCQSSITTIHRKADKHSSGGAMDYEDEKVDDHVADDAHAKKDLTEETVDHGTPSHGTNLRVSFFRPKEKAHKIRFLGMKRDPTTTADSQLL